ncbi:MAG: FadR/GntR family transcriptional regulator [Pseudomonadota bacterium]
MPIRSVAPFRLYQQVAEQIAGLIRAGEFEAGGRLPSERELSAKLKVSRPTVREAMIALEISGLVEVRTGSGIFVLPDRPGDPVKRLVLSDVGTGPLELIDARIVLETAIAVEATKHCVSDDLLRIEKSILAIRDANSIDASRDADRAFHAGIAASTKNAVLKELVDALWREMFSPLFERMGHLTRLFPETHASTIDEHGAIYEALARGDGREAGEAMQHHLSNVRRTLLDTKIDAQAASEEPVDAA